MNFQHITVCLLVDYFVLLICFSILKPIACGQKDYIFIISQYLSVKPFPSYCFSFFCVLTLLSPLFLHTHTHTHTQQRIRIIHLLSRAQYFEIPWTEAHQASLSFTISWSLLKLTSIELVMPLNNLILCHSLLFLPSIFSNIRVFPSESALRIRCPKYWSFSFSISPSYEYLGLMSFRTDWLYFLAVQGTLESSPLPQYKSINSLALSLHYGLTLTSVHDSCKNHSFDYLDSWKQNDVSAF